MHGPTYIFWGQPNTFLAQYAGYPDALAATLLGMQARRPNREKQIGGSGGSLEPLGLFLNPLGLFLCTSIPFI